MSVIMESLSEAWFQETSLIRVALLNVLGTKLNLLAPMELEHLVGLLATTQSVKDAMAKVGEMTDEDWLLRDPLWEEIKRQVCTPDLWLKLISMRD